MVKRMSFSVVFAVAGIFTLLILLALHGYGQSQTAMSVGPVSPGGPSDSVSISMICSYFFLSAVAVLFSRRKPTLLIWTAITHFLLVIIYAMFCISLKHENSHGFVWLGRAAVLAMIMAFYFLPWIVTWRLALSNKDLQTFQEPPKTNSENPREKERGHIKIKPKY